jgi:hypothetical protein
MKNSMTALACGAAMGALALSAPYAAADVVFVVDVTGTWTATNPGAPAVSGLNTNTISWGTSTGPGKSSYVFEGVAPPMQGPYNLGQTFEVGTFTHNNNPITGTSLLTAELTVLSDIRVEDGSGGVIANFADVTSVFDFAHLETPNGANPCANGGANGVGVNVNGCADRVTFTTNPGKTQSITINETEYVLNISSFLIGGSPASEFWTIEAFSNSAKLQGAVVERTSVVPIPAAAWLFGSALIGAVGLGRRNKKKAAA